MVVVFFGTPAFAVPTLEALLASPHRVAAVVTQPDRPRGRGQKTTASPVKDAAQRAGIEVLQPESAKAPEFGAALAALDADIAVVAAYGQILTQAILDTPRLGMINVHASILPRYRGAAPIHRAIVNGDTETGVTIMRIVRALDAGPMLAMTRLPIGPEQTSDELERALAISGAELLIHTLADIAGGRSRETAQDAAASTYAPRLTKDDGRIDWSWPAVRIHNLIRGLHPWPHAATYADGRRLILHRSRPSASSSSSPPGTILDASAEHLRVATGTGTLDLLEIQAEGKRPMPAREFLAGHPLTPGTVPSAAGMIAPARAAAFEVLQALESGRADLPSALAHTRESLDDDRDKALAAEIVTGVLRNRSALDHLITTFSKRDLARVDPEIVAILRLSLYQLLHLTRVPASAVVDDAVDLTKRAKKKSASGFVNAVLRSVSRNRKALPLPAKPPDASNRDAALDYLTVTLSHPRWLSARWYDRLGLDRAERWMQFNNQPAKLTLRTNRLRTNPELLTVRLGREDVIVESGRWAPDALIVIEGRALHSKPAADGEFVVQDEASQLVALLAGPAPGPRVLDTCASPGGKTTAMASTMNGQGLVIACDVRDARVALLIRTVTASGATNVRVVQADVERPLPFAATFDCVMVDAPCSGLGTLRRDPDIRWRRTESDLAGLAAAQARMLRNAAACVAPGGRLIYSTCSSEPEEDDEVADAFLAETKAFAAVDATTIAGVPAAVIDEHGRLRTAPDQHGLECFFGAVFVRSVRL